MTAQYKVDGLDLEFKIVSFSRETLDYCSWLPRISWARHPKWKGGMTKVLLGCK